MDLVRSEGNIVQRPVFEKDELLLGQMEIRMAHAHGQKRRLEIGPVLGKADEVQLGHAPKREEGFRQRVHEGSI